MKLPFESFKELLKIRQEKGYKGHLALDGGFIYQIRLIGQTYPLVSFCIEDILIRAADSLGVGITFTKKDECDLCVVCDDALLGHRVEQLCSSIEKIEAPTFAFGIGSEGPLEKIDKTNLRALKKVLSRMKTISVRNETVANQVKSLVRRNDISIIGEPIFSFKPLSVRAEHPVKRIGISLVEMEELNYNSSKFYENFAKDVDYLIEELSGEAHFLCFERRGACNDEAVSQKIIEKMANKNRAFIHPYTTDLLLSYSRIQEIDYLVSMRSSAGIVALLCGKPVVIMERRGSRGEEIFDLLNCKDILVQDLDTYLRGLYVKPRKIQKIFSQPIDNIITLAKSWEKKQHDFAYRILESF